MKQATLPAQQREFVAKKCPYCGRIYRYARDGLYQPRTCNDYKCVRKELHPEINHR